MAVTLGFGFGAFIRKAWPMTFVAVHCPHCQSDQIVKRGKTARGTQRYLVAGATFGRATTILVERQRIKTSMRVSWPSHS